MGYIQNIEICVVCDECHEGFKWNGYFVPEWHAKNIARKKGWSVGKQWLCPKCRKGKVPESSTDLGGYEK